MKKETALVKKMKTAANQIKFADPEQVKQWEADRKMIAESVDRVKKHIAKALKPEQLLLPSLPTTLTRTNPFYPMSRREMGDRPFISQTEEDSWGSITIEGKKLSIYDETMLLILLAISEKKRSDTFLTTQYEICKLSGVKPSKSSYTAIWESINRLIGTKIELRTWKGKGRSREGIQRMAGTIVAWAGEDETTKKLKIVMNTFFSEMFAEGFVTSINFNFRQSLKGDVTKALYRFYRSQRPTTYGAHIMTLAKAIKLNTNLPIKKLRGHFRTSLRELKVKGYLATWTMTKDHVVSVVKVEKKLKK